MSQFTVGDKFVFKPSRGMLENANEGDWVSIALSYQDQERRFTVSSVEKFEDDHLYYSMFEFAGRQYRYVFHSIWMNLSFKPGDRVFIREAILSRAYNFATMFGWSHDAKAIEALALAQKKRRYFTVLEVDNVKGWVTIDYVEDGKNKVRGTEDLCFYKEQCAELPIEKEEPKTEKRAGLYLL